MSEIISVIDIGSSKICVGVARRKEDQSLKLIGLATEASKGIKRGVITDIDIASKAIKYAIEKAKKDANVEIRNAVVSISGSYVRSIGSSGTANISHGEIGIKDIQRVLNISEHNSDIPNEYAKLHTLPYNFKVDDQSDIENPLGMNGSRIETKSYIITIQKSILNNLSKAINKAGIKVENFVLSGYASSMATLSEDEKVAGCCLIDMGASTCDMIAYLENSIRFNDYLGIGSYNITNDLSIALHTPPKFAEEVKIRYNFWGNNSKDEIEIPKMGDQASNAKVSFEIISQVIYARVEETLMILCKSLDDSGLRNKMGGGIILTGGFSKINGIKELAEGIFESQVRIANPKKIYIYDEKLDNPIYSVLAGLLIYEDNNLLAYEIDSNKKLRHKYKKRDKSYDGAGSISNINIDLKNQDIDEDKKNLEDKSSIIVQLNKDRGLKNRIKKIWNMISQLF